jgi:DNA segregation ATPase FtsK/SpoIIIE-like protein
MIDLNDPNTTAACEFARLLRKLVALGRAAGIVVVVMMMMMMMVVVVVSTQKPSTDVIPSAIRDGVSVRTVFRCTTRDASDTILGSGWATNNISAAETPALRCGRWCSPR